MKNYIIITFLFLILNSCVNKRSDEILVIDENIIINANLVKLPTDTLRSKVSGLKFGNNKFDEIITIPVKNHPFCNFFDDKNGICRLVNDSIYIENGKCGGPSNRFLIKIFKGKFDIELIEQDCTYRYSFKLLQKKLEINKSSFHIGDTLIGKLYYQGIHVSNSIRKIADTITISGKFKLKVHNKFFDYDSLEVERRFFILNNPKPETVKELDLSIWRFNSLPLELRKFKNLEILDLSENDLSTADLSMICEFKNLKTIRLNNCQISKLPSSIFCLKNLEVFEFSHNGLKILPKEFFKLTNIKELRIDDNLLTFLPKEILKLKKLELLDISGYDSINSVKKLPSNFFKSLIYLKDFYIPFEMDKNQFKNAPKSVNIENSI